MQKAAGRSCKTEAWYLQHVCPSVRLKWGWTKNRCPTYSHTTRDQNRSHSPIFSCGRPVGFQYATPLPSSHRSRAWLPTVDTRGCIQKVNQESTTTCTHADAPVANMKDSGVLAGSGGGESSLSQQSGLKGSEVKWEAESITGREERQESQSAMTTKDSYSEDEGHILK